MATYTPPAYNALDFDLTESPYTPPAYNALDFDFYYTTLSSLSVADTLALSDPGQGSLIPVEAITDTLSVAETNVLKATLRVIEHLACAESSQARLVSGRLTLSDVLAVIDERQLRARITIPDTVSLTDTLSIGRLLLVLADQVAIAESTAIRITALFVLADVLELADLYGLEYRLEFADVLALTDACAVLARFICSVADRLSISDNATAQASISLVLRDEVVLADSASWSLQAVLAVADVLAIVGRVQLGTTEYIAWAVNAGTGGAYKFNNFAFNSFAQVAGKNLFCGTAGIYELEGDDDAGATIQGTLKTGRLNLENLQAGFPGDTLKELLSAYLLFDAEGETLLKLTISRRDVTEEHWYALKESAQMAKRQLPISNSLRSVLWQFEIDKLDGKPAAFREIEVIPLYLTRRE